MGRYLVTIKGTPTSSIERDEILTILAAYATGQTVILAEECPDINEDLRKQNDG